MPGDVPGMPGSPGKGDGIGGTWVPLTETSTSNPSSPSSAVLSESPDELDDEELLGMLAVGMEPGLPEEDAVELELELLELEDLELDELDDEGIDGVLDREELDAEGMEGELERELDEDDDGIDGDELLELELELDDAVGIEGDELELLWLVSVLHPASIMLRAEAVISAFIGNAITEVFMIVILRLISQSLPTKTALVLAWFIQGPLHYALLSGRKDQFVRQETGFRWKFCLVVHL
jgi:hypothetical protein